SHEITEDDRDDEIQRQDDSPQHHDQDKEDGRNDENLDFALIGGGDVAEIAQTGQDPDGVEGSAVPKAIGQVRPEWRFDGVDVVECAPRVRILGENDVKAGDMAREFSRLTDVILRGALPYVPRDQLGKEQVGQLRKLVEELPGGRGRAQGFGDAAHV